MAQEEAQVIQVTGDALIRTGDGLVYAIHLCHADGQDTMVELRDAITGATGTARWRYEMDKVDYSNYQFCPSNPMKFDTGIFVNVGQSGGILYVTIVYN